MTTLKQDTAPTAPTAPYRSVAARAPLRVVVDTGAALPARPNRMTAKACALGHRPDYPALSTLFDGASFEQKFQPNSTILLHGDPADAVYQIISGTVRCCMISAQGCRQIPCFSRKNGFLGIAGQTHWYFTAEAVDHVIIKSLPRAVLDREMQVNPPLQQEMRMYVRTLLECREQQLLSMVSTRACDRVYEFLCNFAVARTEGAFTALPMCRRDIADHLGLSVETVSRAFTDLKRGGRIDLATCEKYRITALAS